MLLVMFKRELALRPNCLLTRRPIYLLTRPRILFSLRSPWKKLHYFLHEHGYRIFIIKAEHDLNQRVDQLNQSHIFCDSITYNKFREIFVKNEHSTLTILSDSFLPDLPKDVFQILNNRNSYDQILDHCVHLAELDFYDLDLKPQT